MVKRWEGWKNPWDREYARRGRLWRGAARLDPLPRNAPAPGPIAEIGCGDGKFVAALDAAGYRTIAVDFSRRALTLLPDGSKGGAVQGDARKLPLRGGVFPIVSTRYLLGALLEPDRCRAADEIVRILAPRGVLMVEEFTQADFRFGSGTSIESGTFSRNQGITTHYFEEHELPRLFPSLPLLESEELRHGLNVLGVMRPRVAQRMFFRKRA